MSIAKISSDLASQSVDGDGIHNDSSNSVLILSKAKPARCGNCPRPGHQLGTCLDPL